ncbi:HET domain-containing protein [Fusarium keratoplasticum]|nr:HET domain-containing protein [Fusarium keratoplasticum]
MRLLNTEPIELKYFADNAPPYAILSHTWDEEEVTFQDMEQGRAKDKKGYTKYLGTKASLGDKISERTGVPQAILSGTESLESASVAQRMSWAAGRKTTRLEDRAYSLMGIFDINMPLLYGEGHKAFIRLQEEILRVSDDHSIFAWRHTDTRSDGGLLAETPDAFKGSESIISWNPFTPYNSSFTVTNKGVHLDAPFIAQAEGGLGLVILHCAEVKYIQT